MTIAIWSVFILSGCTILGLGIGAIADSTNRTERPVVLPGWGKVTAIRPGTWVEVVQLNQHRDEGKFVKGLLTLRENGDTIRSMLIALDGDLGHKAINIKDIDYIRVGEKPTSGAMKGLLIGAGADLVAVVVLAGALPPKDEPDYNHNNNNNNDEETESFSCPFVYSFNGEDYLLEGEVFGGSIFEAARRTDLLKLHTLKEKNGYYGIKITNELEEAQYVDELKMIAVDHPVGTEAYATFDGKMPLLSSPRPPIDANDKEGYGIKDLLNEKDELVWISNPFNRDPDKLEDARDWVELTFERPVESNNATLLLNVQNTRWGAVMQKEMLALQGDQLNQWYQLLNTSETYRKELMSLMVREGMLQVKAWNGNDWQAAGFVWEVGPAADRDVVVNLDLARIQSPTLRLRLECPVGFWAINAAAISYAVQSPTEVHELAPSQAVGHGGQNLLAVLNHADQAYYAMPTTSDWAQLSFKALPAKKGFKRSFFLKANGYYTINMVPTGKRQDALIEHLQNTPGAYSQFALQKLQTYRQTATEQLNTASVQNQPPHG